MVTLPVFALISPEPATRTVSGPATEAAVMSPALLEMAVRPERILPIEMLPDPAMLRSALPAEPARALPEPAWLILSLPRILPITQSPQP